MAATPAPPLVLAPLPEEIWSLRRRLTGVDLPSLPDLQVPGLQKVWKGRLQGSRGSDRFEVVLAVTGDGERNARRGIEVALETFRPSQLLAIGVAGALTPDLGAAEVIASRRVLEVGGEPREPSSELLTRAVGLGLAPGTVVTSGRLAATPEAKSRLAARPGVRSPAVVDLESAFYARAADEAGVPWLVLRSVSDTAGESLPSYLEACRDTGGAVRRKQVVFHALTRPWTIPSLVRLARRTNRCSHALADAAARCLAV